VQTLRVRLEHAALKLRHGQDEEARVIKQTCFRLRQGELSGSGCSHADRSIDDVRERHSATPSGIVADKARAADEHVFAIEHAQARSASTCFAGGQVDAIILHDTRNQLDGQA